MNTKPSPRTALIEAIAAGQHVSPTRAAQYPDIAMAVNEADIPDWFVSLVRRPAPRDGARYLFVNGQTMHVSPSAAGPVVSDVELYKPNAGGPRKPVHNPVRDDSAARAAVEVYRRVGRFLDDPSTLRETLSLALPKQPYGAPEAALITLRADTRHPEPLATPDAANEEDIPRPRHHRPPHRSAKLHAR